MQFLHVPLSHLADRYTCDYETGDGHSYNGKENEILIGKYDNELLCKDACVREKLLNDSTINGVTYNVKSPLTEDHRRCWCERRMTGIDRNDDNWKTCFLKLEGISKCLFLQYNTHFFCLRNTSLRHMRLKIQENWFQYTDK